MRVEKTIESLQGLIQIWTGTKQTIALVPTMGGLHDGHLSLIDVAKKNADKVIVSVYLNPTQFSKYEDFDSYPSSIDEDINELDRLGVDCVFVPSTDQIYPNGWSFDYDIGELATILCGKSRPHFFHGVAQVVYRLFDIVKPDIAVFGEKDFQQLLVIRRMVDELSMGIDILSHSIVRESDGLAMSTRNKYLNDKDRLKARLLSVAINRAKGDYMSGSTIEQITTNLRQDLRATFELDYAEIIDANNLKKITNNTAQIGILCAVMLGSTRLIDNVTFRRQDV